MRYQLPILCKGQSFNIVRECTNVATRQFIEKMYRRRIEERIKFFEADIVNIKDTGKIFEVEVVNRKRPIYKASVIVNGWCVKFYEKLY